MRAIDLLTALIVALSFCSAAAGDEEPLLQEGAYEVAVSLELPHLEDMAAKNAGKICVTANDAGGNRGLTVLSENNPLGHCASSDFQLDGNTLTFKIACDGKNAAQAKATYVLLPQEFQGRIEMKMGGKNMTMTETQRGHRIGTCDLPASPRS